MGQPRERFRAGSSVPGVDIVALIALGVACLLAIVGFYWLALGRKYGIPLAIGGAVMLLVIAVIAVFSR